MTPQSPASNELVSLAADLASSIAAFATDYPLVQMLSAEDGPATVWHYIELVVKVFVVNGSAGRVLGQEPGSVAVETGSIEDALTLLRLTEARIQETDWPYVRLA